MGKRLSRRDAELYKRCDEVLHYLWDPIGVAGVPQARDEYSSYLPQVFLLVRNGADLEAVAKYLLEIEPAMGVPEDVENAHTAAEVLLQWRDWIWETVECQGEGSTDTEAPLRGAAGERQRVRGREPGATSE